MPIQPLTFQLRNWSAWAPGVEHRDDWQRWANGELAFENSDHAPKLSNIKPLLRRRFSRLTKMALAVTFDCLEAGGETESKTGAENNPELVETHNIHPHNIRTVFCSRHGEIHRTAKLLDEITQCEPISPMGFSLSVHNTASGLYSIASGNQSASTAIAAGTDTLAMAIVDALGQLYDNVEPAPVNSVTTLSRDKLLVVYADEPLPEFYQPYDDEQQQPHALALLLEKPDAQSQHPAFSLQPRPKLADAATPQTRGEHEPYSLQLIRFLLANKSSRQSIQGEQTDWQWSRCVD